MRFHQLARTLREQCPWDREQTHASLVPYLVEETFELVDALEALDPDDPATDEALIEELGDLLYQIEFHATIAEQEGRFSIADVTAGIHDKLVRRHPHVFGDVAAADAGTVLANWEEIKRDEKGRTSVFDGVARSLPALAYAQHLAAQGGQGRLRLARRRRPAGQGRRGAGRAARGDRRRRRRRGSPTSSATWSSRSSTSPATSASTPSWRRGPRRPSSGAASRPSRRWPPSAASTCAPPTSPRSTRSGTRSRPPSA